MSCWCMADTSQRYAAKKRSRKSSRSLAEDLKADQAMASACGIQQQLARLALSQADAHVHITGHDLVHTSLSFVSDPAMHAC